MTPVWIVPARCAEIAEPEPRKHTHKRLPRLFLNGTTKRASFAVSLSFDDDYSFSSVDENTYALVRNVIISPEFVNLRPWAFGMVTVIDGLEGYTCIVQSPSNKMHLLKPIFESEPPRYMITEPNRKSTDLVARDRLKPLGLMSSWFFIANTYDDAVLAVMAS